MDGWMDGWMDRWMDGIFSAQALLAALEENDEDAYVEALTKHESISRLEPWFVVVQETSHYVMVSY